MPSRTETFGLVMLEALACGLPVAALPVPGPLDVIGDSGVGVLDWDLRAAALRAVPIPAELCRAYALRFSWRASIQQFLGNLVQGADGDSLSTASRPAAAGAAGRDPAVPRSACLRATPGGH